MGISEAFGTQNPITLLASPRKPTGSFRAELYASVSTSDQQTLAMQSRAMQIMPARRGLTSEPRRTVKARRDTRAGHWRVYLIIGLFLALYIPCAGQNLQGPYTIGPNVQVRFLRLRPGIMKLARQKKSWVDTGSGNLPSE
jgi:hypothetical protein